MWLWYAAQKSGVVCSSPPSASTRSVRLSSWSPTKNLMHTHAHTQPLLRALVVYYDYYDDDDYYDYYYYCMPTHSRIRILLFTAA